LVSFTFWAENKLKLSALVSFSAENAKPDFGQSLKILKIHRQYSLIMFKARFNTVATENFDVFVHIRLHFVVLCLLFLLMYVLCFLSFVSWLIIVNYY